MNKPLVVVVDDDRAIRDVLTALLEGEGYAVEALGDGPTACERIQSIRRRRGPIAAITLDLSLPGKNGTSILEELKANPTTRVVPVVIVSASVRMLPPDKRPLAAAVIRKPFDVTHLLATVASVTTSYLPPLNFSTSGAIAS